MNRRKLFFPATFLLMATLACGLGTDEPEPTKAPEVVVTQTQPPPPSPVPTPTIQPSQRLSGQDLPSLNFDPPGESPPYRGRPSLSGPAQTLDTEHFRLHYTLEGSDAPLSEDNNANGHPDWVEEMAIAFEYARFAENEHFGWALPPSDRGLGGDDRYDVYIFDIEGDEFDGLTEGDDESGFYGDNPNTAQEESRSSSSYISLDVHLSEAEEGENDTLSSLEYAHTVAAHEWMHAIQFGYDSREAHDWLWEASANWIEEEVFDDYNEPNSVLNGVFKAPDSCLLTEGGIHQLESENHWYSLWVFIRYLSERFGHDMVREIWEETALTDGFEVWDVVLSRHDTTLENVFRDYSVALLTRNFDEGAEYPIVRLEGEMGLDRIFTPATGVAQFAADYVQIYADQPISVTMTSEGLEGQLVAVESGQAHVYPLVNGSASLDANHYENVYLTVLNFKRPPNEINCAFQPYEVLVSRANALQEPTALLSAPNFSAPSVEVRLADLGLSYIPDGFEFYSGYQMPRDEYVFPDFVDVVVPGPGPVYVLDYFDEAGNYISVYASESPFATLDDFVAQQTGYSPSEIDERSLDGFEYFLVDYSSDKGSFSTGTLIRDNLFIVIEGHMSLAELDTTMRSYISAGSAAVVSSEGAQYSDLALIYIPPGFEFYEAYTQEKSEFYDQENIQWFVPGPGPVTILDYFNAQDQYISVDASDSPFATLDSFLHDIEYSPQPGELITISGKVLLLEDYSDEIGPLSFATFIHQGRFIVIEGEISTDEMRTVVEAWLER